MKFQKKVWVMVFVVLAVMIILSGCESGSSGDSADVVYNFAGSVGEGDFINLDINLSDGEYEYTNRITNEPPTNGTFEEWGSNFYQLDSGDYFLMLEDEVLIATNKEGLPGEQIITALKEANSDYGTEIENTYNIITSLESYAGTVTINSNNTVDINFGADGSFNAPYSFNDDFKAIEIVESASEFRHYGIFLNGEIGIFDSYTGKDSGSSWEGDGMSILVKQDDSVLLSDFEGIYNFADVDSDIGTIEISNTTDNSMDLTVKIINDQNIAETVVNDINIGSISKDLGMFSFDFDIVKDDDSTTLYPWSMMLVPGEETIIVIGTKDPNVFGSDNDENPDDLDGGIFIGIEQ